MSVNTCAMVHMCVEVRGPLAGIGSVFFPYGIWEPNSGPLDWQQVVHFLNVNISNTQKLKLQRE